MKRNDIRINDYKDGKYLETALNESIDPQEKFTREVNTLFKEKDVQDTLQKMYSSVTDDSKQILLDTIEDEFLNKFATKTGSGSKEDDGSDEDFQFDENGSDIDSSADEGSDDDQSGDNDDWSNAFSGSGDTTAGGGQDSSAGGSGTAAAGNPFMNSK